jgi:cell surface protein SprA
MNIRRLSLVIVCSLLLSYSYGFTGGFNLEDYPSYKTPLITQDTLPLQERYNDFITDDFYNPFDIQTREITQEVEYDPTTGNYIIMEKIGDEYYRSPITMSFEDYLEYQSKKDEQEYFSKLAGISSGQKSDSGKVDPMSLITLEKGVLDRMFGGNEITIEPQGNIDLTFGLDYSAFEGGNLNAAQSVQGPFPDFQMQIQMNVDGKIGEKLNLGFNYDTQASFDFDRKIKIDYDTELFSEDDIIKKVEAGNVSFPLRSTLIQGVQSLFGLKTELQFGNLRLTGLLSQQRSNQESLTIEGGSLKQEFDIVPTEYDENRHFFLSHYHRENYERALESVPYVNSLNNIVNVEVWVSNFRNDNASTSRQIAAIADLGETFKTFEGEDRLHNTGLRINTNLLEDENGQLLPDNKTLIYNRPSGGEGNLYEDLQTDEETRLINNVPTNLRLQYNLEQTRDFEIFRGRKLSPSEFTYHPQLGFISLNIRLRTDQILAVSYEYNNSFCDETLFKVGEPTDVGASSSVRQDEGEEVAEIDPEKVIYAKMLKSSNQRVSLPQWDLMMKNVYPLGASQINREDFKFDIFFEDNRDGSLNRFLPEATGALENTPLLSFFNLDRLNSTLDPQPDGIFDYVEGLTINNRSGSIIFPVLEPFGSSLCDLLGGDIELCDSLQFQEIYDTTLVIAEQTLEKNLFVMKGEYKSSVSSEISLGSWNLPQGSVRVTAGSTTLQEGIDYEVDYGIGRLRIINPSYLQSGTPIRVSFEDNSLFSLQQKNMIGLRADYTISENFQIGGTYLKLKERPFTQKVNLGDDPINNRVLGFDMTYGKDVDWVTKVVDKLPFYSTKEKSKINFTAEIAGLKPSHNGAINQTGEDAPSGGVVSIDDFEGAGSPIPLTTQNNGWVLASTPDYGPDGKPGTDGLFAEGNLSNTLETGYNRALLNWGIIDRSYRSREDQEDSYTRTIDQRDFFDRDIVFQITDLFTFDLNYFPSERGQYNFDLPTPSAFSAGVDVDRTREVNGETIFLNEPESRWGGIMRYLPNNDFQAANIEYLDFWVLNPYMDRRDGSGHLPGESGKLIFHLGNVSEDILKDNLQFFENSIPTDEDPFPIEETVWGEIPIRIPIVQGFNLNIAEQQDLGLDGLDTIGEQEKFNDYLTAIQGAAIPINDLSNDPSNDNFIFINDPIWEGNTNIIERSKFFNNPEGNYPNNQNANSAAETVRGNPNPDREDLNGNSSLNQGESFYEYEIDFTHDGNGNIVFDPATTKFFRDRRVLTAPDGSDETWYRFQIPMDKFDNAVGGIEGFRSVQFMRMLVTGFETPKTLRFAEMELVRNTWRRQPVECIGADGINNVEFALDDVGLQENPNKVPFPYVLPPGIIQEQLFNSISTVLQDEKSLALNVCGLPTTTDIPPELLGDTCQASVFRATQLDLRVFEGLEMFVHAENRDELQALEDGELSVYIKLGKDFVNNYYEYEVPLNFSPEPGIPDPFNIWPEENRIVFPLELLTDLKELRNTQLIPNTERFSIQDPDRPQNRVSMKGLPSLGYIKGIEIGIRNNSTNVNRTFCGEVWVNELRLTGLQERGGFAGTSRLEVQMADLGNLTSSASFSSIGWGALDQKVDERAKESVLQYDVAADLSLGKFLPEKWNVKVPFYAQYATEVVTPEFDAYELDLTIDEVEAYGAAQGIDSKERSQEVETIKTFNFTNVRKERGGGGNGKKAKDPKPWQIENITASYAQTEVDRKDFLIREDKSKDQRLKLDYSYSAKSDFIKPFKKVKGKWLKIIKEINFKPLPSSYYVNTEIRRYVNTREFREPDNPQFIFDDRRFTWDRNYGLKWDFFKNLKFNFDATNRAVVDELRQVGIADVPENRDWLDVRGSNTNGDGQVFTSDDARPYWRENFREGGRNKDYNHRFDLSYTAPLKFIPLTDWINVKARYSADYRWTASSLDFFDEQGEYLGDFIENSQQRSVNATFNFDKLYKKSKFLKDVEKKKRKKKKTTTKKSRNAPAEGKEIAEKKGRSKSKDTGPSGIVKALVRPLLSLRSVKFNYRENLGTVVPGLVMDASPEYLGLSSGFDAPGIAFVAGLQPDLTLNDPDNWLQQAATNGWITTSSFQNNQVIQRKTQDYDAKIAIEPFKDFKLDVDFKKQFSDDTFENFKTVKNQGDEFEQLARRNVGSFEVTHFGLNTFFDRDFVGMFDQFKDNRIIISNRLDATGLPHSQDGDLFSEGLGSTQSNVVIPAFLSAYTGSDVNDVSRDVGSETSSGLVFDISRRSYIPRPNWTLRYNGLKNLPMFQDLLSSFTLSHSYKSTLRVNQFRTNQDFDFENINDINPGTGNFYSRFELPLIQISEQFSPLIGIQMKTKKEFNLNVEYRRGRNLDLNTDVLGNLTEKRTEAFTVGIGWIKQGVNIGFLTGDKKGSRKRKRGDDDDKDAEEKKEDRRSGGLGRGSVSNNRPRDMNFNIDFSFQDDITYIHDYNQGLVDRVGNRGQKSIRFNPSIDYNVNENLNLRLFLDYETTQPVSTNNSGITRITRYFSGLTARFNLN